MIVSFILELHRTTLQRTTDDKCRSGTYYGISRIITFLLSLTKFEQYSNSPNFSTNTLFDTVLNPTYHFSHLRARRCISAIAQAVAYHFLHFVISIIHLMHSITSSILVWKCALSDSCLQTSSHLHKSYAWARLTSLVYKMQYLACVCVCFLPTSLAPKTDVKHCNHVSR